MAHKVKRLPWGTIDLDLTQGRVFFQQLWSYRWSTEPGASRWSEREKRRFHTECDKAIWAAWSNRIAFRTIGTADFCRRHRRVPINFDIKRGGGQWTVHVRKVPPGGYYRSNVIFANREINLAHTDYQASCVQNEAKPPVVRCGYVTVAHEFGHAIRAPDEYHAGHKNLVDVASIMNIGTAVRSRHLSQVIAELNTMLAGCAFYL